MPKVSVVIPAYNHAHFVGESIQSVLDQTFGDFDLIVVDDGSTDNTGEVVDSLQDTRVKYVYQRNRGVSAARNTGIQASRGKYIAFLDADDLWLPQKLELQLEALDSAPRAAVVYSDIYYYDSSTGTITGTFLHKFRGLPPRGEVLNQLIEHFFGHPSTLLVRREVFARIGMFDETLLNCEDNDMLFRMASCFEFEVVPVPLIKYRTYAGQMSRDLESSLYYYIAYLNKAMHSPVLDNKMRAKLRKSLAEHHFRYGVRLIRRGKFSTGGRGLVASITADTFMFFYLAMSLSGRIFIRMFALMRMGSRHCRIIKAKEG